ncbi:hypothetical protein [Dongia sedimenti]|uniref:Uncharacterized protein n=1 Tax=Dongia sedimenti TaxID=3064282 RepID=A0ABU0YNH9_9PROT|nr:hypothetical protein [Rhodospirillaceae bacterium R-7]
MAKVPAVNDNRPLPREVPEDDCRNELMAMPDVGALDFTTQFTVWAVRSWVQAFKTRQSFDDVTHRTFARFGLSRSALAIDSLMTMLAASAARSIDIRCVQCRLLSPDEALLIDAMAAAQSGGFFVATVALRQLMPGTAARAALPHLVDLARDLGDAGMVAQPIPPQGAASDAAAPASASRVLH